MEPKELDRGIEENCWWVGNFFGEERWNYKKETDRFIDDEFERTEGIIRKEEKRQFELMLNNLNPNESEWELTGESRRLGLEFQSIFWGVERWGYEKNNKKKKKINKKGGKR